MARVLYFDCFSGASGDMIVGALLDAGVPLEALRGALGSLALEGHRIEAEPVTRAGVAATKFRLTDASHHDHQHDSQDHHHQGHHDHPGDERRRVQESGRHASGHHHHDRHLAEIERVIDDSSLSSAGKRKALDLLRRLVEVEAAIHRVPVEQVRLHEVGALDSIVDITGAVFALEWLGADRIVSSPLNVGGGMVRCAHGTLPVPAPATARLLMGVPVYSSGLDVELVTPTGALLVAGYASAFGPLPPMRIERIGYGAGERDLPAVPNVLRVFVGESDGPGAVERVTLLECEIDDMNPQIFGILMDRLYAAGALEVFYAPVQMKKNRPGTLVTVIAPIDRREVLADLLFRETTTIGLRYQDVTRERLDRELVIVATPFGSVPIKIARRSGRIVNVCPEFEDCARLAADRGLSVKEVQALVMKAYLDTRAE